MAITHTRTNTYKDASSNVLGTAESISTGVRENNIDIALVIGTDVSVPYTATRANILSLCLLSDVDLTLETNSGSSPQETISLKAGVAKTWTLAGEGLAACPFSGNVTGLFATNAAAANLKVRTLLTA